MTTSKEIFIEERELEHRGKIMADVDSLDESQLPASINQEAELENLLREAVCSPEEIEVMERMIKNGLSVGEAEDLKQRLILSQLDPLHRHQGGYTVTEKNLTIAINRAVVMPNT